MQRNFMGDFAVLHELYEKKKFGREPLNDNEKRIVSRLVNSKVLRSAIDPSVPFGFLYIDEYVAGKFELELTYFAVTGRRPVEDAPVKHLLDVVARALECARDAEVLYKQYA